MRALHFHAEHALSVEDVEPGGDLGSCRFILNVVGTG